jgi:hypothetical protein
VTPPKKKTSDCSCKKKKPKPKKPRTVCYKGSYQEKAKGLLKFRREQIPCS